MKKLEEFRREQKVKTEKAKQVILIFAFGLLVGYAMGTRDAIDKIFD